MSSALSNCCSAQEQPAARPPASASASGSHGRPRQAIPVRGPLLCAACPSRVLSATPPPVFVIWHRQPSAPDSTPSLPSSRGPDAFRQTSGNSSRALHRKRPLALRLQHLFSCAALRRAPGRSAHSLIHAYRAGTALQARQLVAAPPAHYPLTVNATCGLPLLPSALLPAALRASLGSSLVSTSDA